jgi:ferredoxin
MTTPRTFFVELQPQGWQFVAPSDASLLASARAAGIDMRSSCRNGTCRTCMCRLREGEVSYAIDWPGLSREEKQDGWILPCVARAESALVIEAPLSVRV